MSKRAGTTNPKGILLVGRSAIVLAVGGALGATLLAGLTGPVLIAALAFGTAVLLYLVNCFQALAGPGMG